MIGKGLRIATLAAGTVSMLTILAGPASAANGQSYTTNVIGPISSQTACTADAAAANDPPQSWTSACRFSDTYPGTSVSDPGWYYNLHILITP